MTDVGDVCPSCGADMDEPAERAICGACGADNTDEAGEALEDQVNARLDDLGAAIASLRKPRPYFTVNVTVEDADGEQVAVWRIDQPLQTPETALVMAGGVVLAAQDHLNLGFDRMDDDV